MQIASPTLFQCIPKVAKTRATSIVGDIAQRKRGQCEQVVVRDELHLRKHEPAHPTMELVDRELNRAPGNHES